MELEEVSLRQKVLHLEDERKRIKARLEVLTDLQRKYAGLNREVRAREAENKTLDGELQKVRREYQSNKSDFTIISEAKVPLFSLKSNRKIIVIVVVFLCNMIGFTLILGLELMDTTVKSAAELTQKFSLPVLGIIPKIKDIRGLFPEEKPFPPDRAVQDHCSASSAPCSGKRCAPHGRQREPRGRKDNGGCKFSGCVGTSGMREFYCSTPRPGPRRANAACNI